MPLAKGNNPIRQIAALAGLYAVALILGGAIFVGLFQLGAFARMSILFYRGLFALAATFVLLVALLGVLGRRLPKDLAPQARDLFGAATVAVSLLCAAFVLAPVTVDRSISVFMLSRFDARSPMTEQQARDAFVSTYVDDWAQIGRRLREQEVSGNLRQTPQGWEITPQGRAFMRTARLVSRLFGADPRFVGR
ncbi:hypothetical protein [Rhodoblastus sp.]|uniref:hypothetical protein n=1 Tax=Rhodoblastus sp. TaxID=1962975 RepID=UPI003F9AD1AB